MDRKQEVIAQRRKAFDEKICRRQLLWDYERNEPWWKNGGLYEAIILSYQDNKSELDSLNQLILFLTRIKLPPDEIKIMVYDAIMDMTEINKEQGNLLLRLSEVIGIKPYDRKSREVLKLILDCGKTG